MSKKLLKYFFIALFFVAGELTFNICSNIISASKPVQEFVHKTEVFLGFSILEQKLLIKEFKANKSAYSVNEPITFELELKEPSFLYLLNLSTAESCLVFPNSRDAKNSYQKALQKLPAHDTYSIRSTTKGVEHFHLIASQIKLDFSEFNPKSIYACTSAQKGRERLEKLKQSNMVDVYRVDIEVK
jgi:hypothetical protein